MVNNKVLTVRVINVIDYIVFTFNLQNLSCLTFNTKIVRNFDIKLNSFALKFNPCTDFYTIQNFLQTHKKSSCLYENIS